MIRKLLVIAAAVAMPASALAAVTAVGSGGAAGALAMKGKTYKSQTCAISGGVTFATPGLSYTGTLSKKSTTKSVSSATATGTGCGSGVSGAATLNSKIVSDSTLCSTAESPPPICADATSKLKYAYDTASSLASSGVSSIVTSLSKGLKLYDNGNKVVAEVTESGTSAVDPGGDCGTNVGFELSGDTSIAGLTYDLLLCITGDTGTGTSGAFYTDYIGALEGSSAVLATGIFGGASGLTFTEA